MLEDVVRVVISYLSLYQVRNFFDAYGLEYGLKFRFRMIESCSIYELKYMLGEFLNVIVGARICGLDCEDSFLGRCDELVLSNCRLKMFCAHSALKSLVIYGENLEKLDLSRCKCLRKIRADCCLKLKSVDWGEMKGMKDLQDVNVGGDVEVDEVIVNKLHKLSVYGKIENVWMYGRVRNLKLYEINDLRDFRGWERLRCLCLMNCGELVNIEGIGKLRNLVISGCRKLNLGKMSECKGLKSLVLYDSFCTNLDMLSGCEKLERLELMQGYNLVNIDGLRGCRKLKYVKLEWCYKLKEIDVLRECVNLREIYLDYVQIGWMGGMGGMEGRVEGIECISFLKRLKSLTLLRVDLGDLPSCEWLEELSLEECSNMSRIGMMLSGLKILYVENNKDIGWDALSNCKELHTIVLKNCNGLDKWENLWKCSKLRTLKAVRCYIPKEFFKGCEIKDLEIDFSYGRFEAFTEWEGRVGLERVKLFRCHLRIGMLVGCVKLREIDLNDWRDVIDVSVLANCPNLEIIRAINCCHLRGYEILERKGVSVVRI